MKLPSFVLRSNINKNADVDDESECKENIIDSNHYDQYPWPVTYQYNSRGYRDQEWPSDLTNAIWCFGDSFTVGIGSPITHTWCYCLQQLSQQHIINISMNGASNDWIARKIKELLSEVIPQTIVIQWSYAHRREADIEYVRKLLFFEVCQYWDKFYAAVRDPSWPDASLFDFYTLPQKIQNEIRDLHFADNETQLNQWLDCVNLKIDQIDDESRRMHYLDDAFVQDDIDNIVACINQVEWLAAKYDITTIHSFIPDFIDSKQWENIKKHLPVDRHLEPFKKLDLARDKHHYDIVTATYVAEKIDQLIRLHRAKSQSL
jgi:hypothetical protein